MRKSPLDDIPARVYNRQAADGALNLAKTVVALVESLLRHMEP